MQLKQRTILITGGSRGIGLQLAQDLIARGNTVIVTGRDKAQLDAAKEQLPALHIVQSDVSDKEAIVALYARVIGQHPQLNVLINNAGIMRNLDMNVERSLEDVTREMDINLTGPIRMVQQFLPHLKAQSEALIVNVSSGLAFVPLAISPVYSATKAGMHAFTQALRMQLVDTCVSVVELAPPGVETALFRTEFEAFKDQKAMSTQELSRRAISGIEAGKYEIRPGQAALLKIMGRLAPEFALRQLTKASKPKSPAAHHKSS